MWWKDDHIVNGIKKDYGSVDGLSAVFLITWIIGLFTTVGTLLSIPAEKRYERRLKKAIPETHRIEARVDSTSGKVYINQFTDDAFGTSMKNLRSFDPDDEDAIYAYVSEQRDRLNGPDLTKAKAIAKVINEG
jgi:hypothetical protein